MNLKTLIRLWLGMQVAACWLTLPRLQHYNYLNTDARTVICHVILSAKITMVDLFTKTDKLSEIQLKIVLAYIFILILTLLTTINNN